MDITIIVATHERATALSRMIQSFRIYYPQIPIIAVDSSIQENPIQDITYIHVPSDTGISQQRNIALGKVTTTYFLLVDDDFVCNEHTNILWMLHILQEKKLWILGWWVHNIWVDNYDFHGIYEISDNVLYHFVWIDHDATYDVIFNFFIADTAQVLRFWWWDSNLKYAREHDDFFLQAKKHAINIGYNPHHYIEHVHEYKHHSWTKSIVNIEYFCKKRDINDKIEIRYIKKDDNSYISYHHCIQHYENQSVPTNIQKKIEELYGIYPIISS